MHFQKHTKRLEIECNDQKVPQEGDLKFKNASFERHSDKGSGKAMWMSAHPGSDIILKTIVAAVSHTGKPLPR